MADPFGNVIGLIQNVLLQQQPAEIIRAGLQRELACSPSFPEPGRLNVGDVVEDESRDRDDSDVIAR
ncbi:hypothetical protein D3C83_256740 [compost metagenome]